MIVCDEAKLLALSPARLYVDTDDSGLNRELSGYRRVRVAPGKSIVVEIAS